MNEAHLPKATANDYKALVEWLRGAWRDDMVFYTPEYVDEVLPIAAQSIETLLNAREEMHALLAELVSTVNGGSITDECEVVIVAHKARVLLAKEAH